MTTATTLMGCARPFLRALSGNSRAIVGVEESLLFALYQGQIQAVTEPTVVAQQVLDFYMWPFVGDPGLKDAALELNQKMNQLSFKFHLRAPSISNRMAALTKELNNEVLSTYGSGVIEGLYKKSGEIQQQAQARGINFYPLNVRNQMLQAATLLRRMDHYNELAQSLRRDREPAFTADCARYYTNLFRIASKILLTPEGQVDQA